MRTRNLTAVILDGEYKIAQLGRSLDSQPSGQGLTALEFYRFLHDERKLDCFKKTLQAVRFLSDKELNRIRQENDFDKRYIQLWETLGAEILWNVYAGSTFELENGLATHNHSERDIKYRYILNLDKNTFEVS